MAKIFDCEVSEIADRLLKYSAPVLPDETDVAVIHGVQTEDASLNEETITCDVRFLAVETGAGA